MMLTVSVGFGSALSKRFLAAWKGRKGRSALPPWESVFGDCSWAGGVALNTDPTHASLEQQTSPETQGE